MSDYSVSIRYIPPELRHHIALYCNRATVASLCQVDTVWNAESTPLLYSRIVMRVFYAGRATTATQACLETLKKSKGKTSLVTQLKIFIPFDDENYRKLVQRIYLLLPRLPNLRDLRVYIGSDGSAHVNALLELLARGAIQLHTLYLPRGIYYGTRDETARVEEAVRTQRALRTCLLHSPVVGNGDGLFFTRGIVPADCMLLGLQRGVESCILMLSRLSHGTIDCLARILEDMNDPEDMEYPWELFGDVYWSGMSPPPVRATAPGPGHPAIASNGPAVPVLQSAADTSHTAAHAAVDSRLFRQHDIILQSLLRQPIPGRRRDYLRMRRHLESLPNRMRHPRRQDINTLQILADEVPDPDVMRRLQALCPQAINLSIAFPTAASNACPRTIAAFVRPFRNIRALSLHVGQGVYHGPGAIEDLRVPARALDTPPRDPMAFVHAILDAGCSDIAGVSFWDSARCTLSTVTGLWEVGYS